MLKIFTIMMMIKNEFSKTRWYPRSGWIVHPISNYYSNLLSLSISVCLEYLNVSKLSFLKI